MDIPLSLSVVFQHGQLADKDDEIEEEKIIIYGEDHDWLRKNIREAGIKIRTTVQNKMNGVELVVEVEHNLRDYDCLGLLRRELGQQGNLCRELREEKNIRASHSFFVFPFIVRYDAHAGHLTSNLFTGTEWDPHKSLLG